jgi:hypothetical protein
MKTKKPDRLAETKAYIVFLEKRLASENFHRNESAEVVEKTKEKLKKAKLVVKCLETGKK